MNEQTPVGDRHLDSCFIGKIAEAQTALSLTSQQARFCLSALLPLIC